MSKDTSLLDHAAASIQRHAGVPGAVVILLLLRQLALLLSVGGLIVREVRAAA
jgi:hypothetical protein